MLFLYCELQQPAWRSETYNQMSVIEYQCCLYSYIHVPDRDTEDRMATNASYIGERAAHECVCVFEIENGGGSLE